MVVRKDQLEASLREEHQLIESGRLKEDSPLDTSESFSKLCEACRRGDLKSCQQMITTEGVNINARDRFDYTPLILVRGFSLQCRLWLNHASTGQSLRSLRSRAASTGVWRTL